MGFAENMRIWSGINCGLASLVGYTQMKSNGVDTNTAIGATAGNVLNGLARNEVAYEMQKMGNPVGNMINMYAGYGNPVSNAIGTAGLLGACSPWVFFNAPCTMFYTPIATPFFGGLGYGDFSYHSSTTINRGFFC